MIDSINQYWARVPSLKEPTAKAFVKGFTVSFVNSGMKRLNVKSCLMIASLWTVATAVNGLLAPAFKELEDWAKDKLKLNPTYLGPIYEASRGIFSLIVSFKILKAVKGYNRTDLQTQILLCAINIFVDSIDADWMWGKKQNTNQAHQMVPSNIII